MSRVWLQGLSGVLSGPRVSSEWKPKVLCPSSSGKRVGPVQVLFFKEREAGLTLDCSGIWNTAFNNSFGDTLTGTVEVRISLNNARAGIFEIEWGPVKDMVLI